MSNPFHGSLEDNFRGQHVRVVSNNGNVYEGWVERLHHHDRHVVLRDATRLDGDVDVGAVMIAHADTIEVLDPSSRIEAVAVDAVEPSPYHAADFELAANRGYVSTVRDREFVGSFPVAREREDGRLEVVAGHKRLWVCRQAGVDEHPVEIVDLDEWDAARRFIADHIPHAEQVHDGGTADGYYDDQEIAAALHALVDRWGERVFTVERIAFNIERLNIATDAVDGVDEAEGADGDADTDAPTTGDDPEPVDDGDSDELEDEAEHACAVDGCDFVTESQRGLSVHHSRVHDEEADASGHEQTLAGRIAAVLEEHGELPSADIGELLDASSSHYRHVLTDMRDDGRVVARPSPDDGRRKLYRLEGESEEADVGEPDEAEETGTAGGDVGEGDDADDGPENDESDRESLPRECCGKTIDSSLEWIVHRTEEHGASRTGLDNLEAGEFEATVREADSLWDLTDEFSWGIERTLRLLAVYDLVDALGDADEGVEQATTPTEDGDTSPADDGDTAADTDQTPPVGQEPDGTDGSGNGSADTEPALDLSEYGVGRDELVDAITDSQTVHHVQRELRVDRETVADLLDATGLLEQLGTGCAPISPREAERAVQEVSG